MAFCSHCGNELTEGARFCPSCGTAIASAELPLQTPASEDIQESGQGSMGATPTTGQLRKDVRNVAMLCHLAAFAGFIGIPFGHILGPLLVWLLKREESPFVDAHGKESLNFQISMTIYFIISAILMLVVIGFVLLVVLFVFEIIAIIIAATRANNGVEYRYPLSMRFLK